MEQGVEKGRDGGYNGAKRLCRGVRTVKKPKAADVVVWGSIACALGYVAITGDAAAYGRFLRIAGVSAVSLAGLRISAAMEKKRGRRGPGE